MVKEIKLPELGENIETAQIVSIPVKTGDKVKVDQVILEIETDKATIEVPSEFEGIIKKISVKAGDTIKVGQSIFSIEEESSDQTNKEKIQPVEMVEKKIEESQTVVKQKTPSAIKQKSGLYEFKLPELGENIETADILKITVKAGDKIKTDQTLLEIETDKATVEVPSEVNGIVKEVKVTDGYKARVGEIIMIIETSDDVEPDSISVQDVPKSVESPPPAAAEQKPKVVEMVGPPVKAPAIMPTRNEISKKLVAAAPSVRRFAREIGIDIHNVQGRGPGGRISIDDVKLHAKTINESLSQSGPAGFTFGIKPEPLPDFSKWGEIERASMSNVRRKTAEHLSYAWTAIPHVTQFDKADMTDLEILRKKFGKSLEAEGAKLTVTAILVKIVASALKIFPQFNSSIDMGNNEIIHKKYFNIGIAVDTDRGLIVPVLKNADKKNIKEIAFELGEISQKARDKKTSLEEMQGGSLTISNLGGIGGTYFTPIVNSPEVAILGVSRGQYEPVFIDGEFKPRLMLPLSLSYDHRIIDGADAIKFLRWIINALENPFVLSLEG